MTRTQFRCTSIAICLGAIALTVLLVTGVLPGYLGTGAFVAVCAWIAYGIQARRTQSPRRQ